MGDNYSINDAIEIRKKYLYINKYINQLYSTKTFKTLYVDYTNTVPDPLQNCSPSPGTYHIKVV